jgi:hypothetical protein
VRGGQASGTGGAGSGIDLKGNRQPWDCSNGG